MNITLELQTELIKDNHKIHDCLMPVGSDVYPALRDTHITCMPDMRHDKVCK